MLCAKQSQLILRRTLAQFVDDAKDHRSQHNPRKLVPVEREAEQRRRVAVIDAGKHQRKHRDQQQPQRTFTPPVLCIYARSIPHTSRRGAAVVTIKCMANAPSAQSIGEAFAEAVAIIARLRGPGGCPWDREQTLDSIKPHTLEETYEVFDAIDRRAWPELRDELGDLLLQVIFYAQIADDEKHFNIEEVVRGLSAKLIRRHPHIFADAIAETASDVNRTWERVKQAERADKQAHAEGILGDVPRFVPALVEARKLGSKAAKVGFDWPDVSGLFDKVQEEIKEVRAELTDRPDIAKLEEEVGDLFFVLSNLSRHLSVDPEQALRKANAKFRRRFRSMELAAECPLDSLSLAQMEDLWSAAKQAERSA